MDFFLRSVWVLPPMPVALSRTPCKYLRWRALQRFANVVMFSILGVFGGPYSASGRALRELESVNFENDVSFECFSEFLGTC